MTRAKNGKHNGYVCQLEDQVRHLYEFTIRNLQYRDPRPPHANGEIDLLGKRGNTLAIYEVKCNGNVPKAKEQLERALGVFDAEGLEFELYHYDGGQDILKRLR